MKHLNSTLSGTQNRSWKLGIAGACALVAVTAITLSTNASRLNPSSTKVQETRVESGAGQADVDAALAQFRLSTDRALERNRAALELFEQEINGLRPRLVNRSVVASSSLSSQTATYKNCSVLIYYSAGDSVRGGGHMDRFLDSLIRPGLNRELNQMKAEVTESLDRLIRELQRSTFTLATDLSGTLRGGGESAALLDLEGLDQVKLDEALRSLGFSGVSIGLSLGFDAYAVWQTKVIQRLWEMVKSIVARVFARQVAVAVASVSAAAIDGPLPFGDIFLGVGILWTGYDIYASQAEFESNLRMALEDNLRNAADDLVLQAIEAARVACRNCDASVGEMGKEALIQIQHGPSELPAARESSQTISETGKNTNDFSAGNPRESESVLSGARLVGEWAGEMAAKELLEKGNQ